MRAKRLKKSSSGPNTMLGPQDRGVRERRPQRRLARGLGAGIERRASGGPRRSPRRGPRRPRPRLRRGLGDLARQAACRRCELALAALEQDADQVDGTGRCRRAGARLRRAPSGSRARWIWPMAPSGCRRSRAPDGGVGTRTTAAQLRQALDHVAADEARAAEDRHHLVLHRCAPSGSDGRPGAFGGAPAAPVSS